MKLVIIGSGYVGLVAGACFGDTGNDVTLVDVDRKKIDMLRAGHLPIYEPGLDELVARNVQAGRLQFTTDLVASVRDAEVVFLAVGTPSAPDGSVDMRAMEEAARQVAAAMTHYTVIVTKSTVPVGTHSRISGIIRSITNVEFDYVSNPEFLKEGAAVADFLKPDRVIVGVTSERALKIIRHLYAPFMRRTDRLLVMDLASAELTKYACNAMLATRVTFMNEMARLCDCFGADIEMVRRGMGTDRRIGPDFLFPSLGYGGSCFPKDVRALISMGRMANRPLRIVEAVDLGNREQREEAFNRISQYFDGRLTDKKFAVWGLAFKAQTDDVRESPALTVIQRLVGAGAAVAAHDPKATDTARAVLGDKHITYCENMYEALSGAHALVICTEWQEYRTPDFGRIRSLLAEPVIFDGRNLYELDWMAGTGIAYLSIGRPVVNVKKVC
ncbi:MAG: UDP-glucose/GDP-mannose dehydrogenase family protein [Phycisphaerae bacterium]